MGDTTAIAWTDHTFNPWLGCHKVSAGCKHCYAERLVERMSKSWNGPKLWGLHGPRRRTSASIWGKPRRWNDDAAIAGEPAKVFCASLADVFEDEPGPNEWRPEVFELIRQTPWLDWQLLTKRPENIARMVPDDWSVENYPNVWLGTSIEDNRVADRAFDLTRVPAHVHFVSYEPAIGPVDELDLTHIEWLIAGGESGPRYRPMDLDWVRDIRRRCEEGWSELAYRPPCVDCDRFPPHCVCENALRCSCELLDEHCICAGKHIRTTAFFFKQSAAPRTEMGIELDGEIVRNYPESYDRLAAIQ